MNSRKLKKHLPRDWRVKTTAAGIRVTARERLVNGRTVNVVRTVGHDSGWKEIDAAAFLRSKLPTVTFSPR